MERVLRADRVRISSSPSRAQ